jgi:Ca2+:H+ antiporter
MPNIDSIKRAARKEAWYGDSYNPFRKVRSSTWNAQRDEEQADARNTLAQVQTEPIPESPSHAFDPAPRHPDPVMTTAANAETSPEGSPSAPAGEKQEPTGPRRRRLIPGFGHKGDEEPAGEADEEEKRPWYKGKNLYHAEPFTTRNQLQRTIFNSWVNILLLAAPVGIAINYAGVNGKIVFVVNFIAIIPLAGMLSFATEEIALHVGESLGGLLNASFGYVRPLSCAPPV